MQLDRKIVLITGASRGIGRCTAIAFAKAGAHVVIGYISSKRSALATKKACDQFTTSEIIKLDVRSDADRKKAAAFIKKTFGHIDILINNAGIGYFGPFDEITRKEIEETLDVNILGPMLMVKSFLPELKKRKESVIINIASMAGYHIWADGLVYCPTKWALRAFTHGLALELPKRIKVYNVNPDRTATSMGGFIGDDPNDVAAIIMNTAKGTYKKKSGSDIDIPDYL